MVMMMMMMVMMMVDTTMLATVNTDNHLKNWSRACSKISSSISMLRSSSIAPSRSVSLSMQRPEQAWKKLLKVGDRFANGPIPASANHR